MSKTELIWQTHSLDSIVHFFADKFELKKGQKILRAEWFIDPVKNTVIFRLLIEST